MTTTRKRPILLTVQELTKPMVLAQRRFAEVGSLQKGELHPMLLHGLFVMGVSTFETTLLDALAAYYRRVPQALPDNEATFSKSESLCCGNVPRSDLPSLRQRKFPQQALTYRL